jgi:hypothetical protein
LASNWFTEGDFVLAVNAGFFGVTGDGQGTPFAVALAESLPELALEAAAAVGLADGFAVALTTNFGVGLLAVRGVVFMNEAPGLALRLAAWDQ